LSITPIPQTIEAMLNAFSLMAYFIVALTLVNMLILLALSPDRKIKAGYGLMMASYLWWSRFLGVYPAFGGGAFWLYTLPAVWLILLLRFGFPHTRQYEFPSQSPEPRYTQEYLRGPSARQEALIFYFLLMLIGLIILQVMLLVSGSLPMG